MRTVVDLKEVMNLDSRLMYTYAYLEWLTECVGRGDCLIWERSR